MTWTSCLEDIQARRDDLMHLLSPSVGERLPDGRTSAAVVDAAQRTVQKLWEILDLATSPGLELAAELKASRAETAQFRQQILGLQARLACASRQAIQSGNEAANWRAEYFKVCRQNSRSAGRVRRRR